ncbi:hypothetical protein MERGE_001287 [Pneumocystis wakefieldiae]|uniref:Uncharacterized protein n=1 Tax=Pneumocystis wakefieldiae TaxID=38082 RepID=A0A899FSP2_9ASCO|nr:hypothetical protein MERGE_001287 [Pneumocystis wakefieldiae]
MQLFGMLLRDNERMASAEGLDIKKCKPGRVIYASYYGDIRFLGFKQLVGGLDLCSARGNVPCDNKT